MLFLYFFPFCTELWISYLYDTDCYISCIITQFSRYLNWTFTISTSPILLVCFCIPSLFPIPSTWHFFTFNSVSHFLLQSKILFKAIFQTFTFFSISVSQQLFIIYKQAHVTIYFLMHIIYTYQEKYWCQCQSLRHCTTFFSSFQFYVLYHCSYFSSLKGQVYYFPF